MKCTINSDMWQDVGKIFFVHSSKSRPDSTAVTLVLEDDGGNIHERVVANHQIEWIEEDGS